MTEKEPISYRSEGEQGGEIERKMRVSDVSQDEFNAFVDGEWDKLKPEVLRIFQDDLRGSPNVYALIEKRYLEHKERSRTT